MEALCKGSHNTPPRDERRHNATMESPQLGTCCGKVCFLAFLRAAWLGPACKTPASWVPFCCLHVSHDKRYERGLIFAAFARCKAIPGAGAHQGARQPLACAHAPSPSGCARARRALGGCTWCTLHHRQRDGDGLLTLQVRGTAWGKGTELLTGASMARDRPGAGLHGYLCKKARVHNAEKNCQDVLSCNAFNIVDHAYNVVDHAYGVSRGGAAPRSQAVKDPTQKDAPRAPATSTT